MTDKALVPEPADVPEWLERAGVTNPTAVMPLVQEVVDLREPKDVARAWDELDHYIASLVTFRKAMGQVMLAYMDSQAKHTLAFEFGKIRGDRSKTVDDYDPTILVELLEADPPLPVERYDELVKQKPVEYSISKQVAAAISDSNPTWKAIIDRARVTQPRARSISRTS